jgi:hypothetical protein
MQKHNFVKTQCGARKLAVNLPEGFALEDKGLFVVIFFKVQTA